MAKTNGAAEAAPNRAPLFGSVVPQVDQVVQASNTLLSAWMRAGDEMLALSKNTFDHGITVSRQLAETQSLAERLELQTQFGRTIMQDYVEGVKKLAELGTRSVVQSLSELQNRKPAGAAEHREAA
jgi:hypothetical protein